MIYTSYFGNMKRIGDNVIYVAISATIPEGVKCLHLKKLAPSYGNLMAFKNDSDWGKYSKRYKDETLSKFRPDEIISMIYNLIGEQRTVKDIVLLCYEKEYSRCHRSIVAEYLTSGGILVKEYSKC